MKTRNDRLIGLAIGKQSPSSLDDVGLDKQTFSEIENFFISYNRLSGKKFKVLGKSGAKKALAVVSKCQA
jgi:inorganic pyrophosphatase